MRNYWLKIGLGALAVFAGGMLLLAVARAVKGRVHHVAESSDPIELPLPFVPFRLDGERIGTFKRVVINRHAPDEVSSVDLHVDLGDLATMQRIQGCGILARIHTRAGGRGATFQNADFSCVRGDSAQAGYESFGEVHFVPGDHIAPLLVTPAVANELRREMIQVRARHADDSVAAHAESIAAAAERTADSISEAASRLTDSITALHERAADSIRSAALRRADSALRRRK
ncbi:MAG TPA: hypothetical protein VFU46_11285 [Gemmatimonadales bacterium]|nr:hypothetical protein [Gemmatimonadales bacterium]